MDALEREKAITQTSVIGVIANIILAAFKAFVGLMANSIAIILDAVNNLTDVLSSLITIAGVKLAHKKPDKDHPFGHGRIEYFSAIIISSLILAAGIMSLIESGKKIFKPETPEYAASSLIIIAVAIVTKFFLGRFVTGRGHKYNSDALIASGADASFDAIISAATLAGALITFFFGLNVDGYLGAAIALLIIKAGLELFMDSIGHLIGNRPDSVTTKAIKALINNIPGVHGAYDLVLHNYGPDKAIGSVHIEIPDNLSAEDIHQLTKKIQAAVQEQFNLFLTIGIYAIDSTKTDEREKINKLAMAHPGVLGTHGHFFDKSRDFVSFDVAIDFTVPDKKALEAEIIKEVQSCLPGYEVAINFDAYYSD